MRREAKLSVRVQCTGTGGTGDHSDSCRYPQRADADPCPGQNSEMSASAASQGRPMSDHLLTAKNLEEGSILRQPRPVVRL